MINFMLIKVAHEIEFNIRAALNHLTHSEFNVERGGFFVIRIETSYAKEDRSHGHHHQFLQHLQPQREQRYHRHRHYQQQS